MGLDYMDGIGLQYVEAWDLDYNMVKHGIGLHGWDWVAIW
jgi:hypothetical protein